MPTRQFAAYGDSKDPIRSLWSIVLHQGFERLKRGHRAASDSTGSKSSRTIGRMTWSKERRWLDQSDDNFEFICLLMHLDPEAIRERVRAWPEYQEPK